MTTLSSLLSTGYQGAQGATGPKPGMIVGATGSASSITPISSYDTYEVISLATNATINAPSITAYDGQRLMLRIKDSGSAVTLSFSTSSGAYRSVGVSLPVTTISGKVLYVACVYNSVDNFWDVIGVASQ